MDRALNTATFYLRSINLSLQRETVEQCMIFNHADGHVVEFGVMF